MALVNNGNIEVYDVLTARYKNRLMNYSYYFLHNYTISQDIVEEAFLRILEKKRRNSKDTICLELFSIVSKMMHYILKQRKMQYRTGTDSIGESESIKQLDIDGYYDNNATQIALDFLEAHNREALILRDIEGMSYTDISVITHEPVRKVENRVHTARMTMINSLTSIH